MPRLIRETKLINVRPNNLGHWSAESGVRLNQVAKDTSYSVSTVYKISTGVMSASAKFRLAFLGVYGAGNYRLAFGEPGETDEIKIYKGVNDAKL
jgi:hypothetical protein